MLKQFEKQQYLNIETFRKNGQGVKTPVWFAQDGETLHIWTQAGAGKAKRIRNNGTVRIAPCTSSGQLLGDWQDASAIANNSEKSINYTANLFKKKYGLMFNVFSLFSKVRGKKNISIEVHLS